MRAVEAAGNACGQRQCAIGPRAAIRQKAIGERQRDVAVDIDAKALTGEAGTDAASAVLCRRGVGTVALTLGSEGALVREGQGPAQRVPAPAVAAVDTTGAGDVLAGVMAAAIDRGLPLMSAVRWAVAAASRKVTRAGTSSAFPTSAELAALARAMALP